MTNATQPSGMEFPESSETSQSGWRRQILRRFSEFAGRSAAVIGSASAFVVATLSVLLWAITGPFFHYSDTWQLVINTSTTVVTFLAVFLIQHSQNRDSKAIQLKLDELIRSKLHARNTLIDLEHCTEEEMEIFEREFAKRRRD